MGYDAAMTRGVATIHARYSQEFPINSFLRDHFFGNAPIISKFPTVTIETKRRGRKVATQIRRGQGPTELLARDDHSRSIYETPYYSDKSPLTAEDLTTFSFGETPEAPFDNMTKAMVVFAEKRQNIEDSFSRTEELQCAELLVTGKVMMKDKTSIVFGSDSTLIGVNPVVKWDATSGVKMLKDLKDGMFAVRNASGVLPNEVIVTPDVHVLMVENAEIAKAMDIRNFDLGSMTIANIDGFGGVSFGGQIKVPGAGVLNIYVYAESYDKDGVVTELLPPGTVILANKRNLGRMSYAALNGTQNGFPAFIPGSRYVVVSKAEGDEEEAAITIKMAPLAQPISLDTWMSMNVLVSKA
jgi:hypothetical protein